MMYVALLLGLAASLHCVGMCGPIALALPVHGFTPVRKWTALIVYNLGRAVTYSGLGAVMGGIGYAVNIQDWQRPFSIIAGTGLLAGVFFYSESLKGGHVPAFLRKGVAALQKKMQGLLRRKGMGAPAVLGVLNGLLPCGMVYVALIGAAAETGVAAGAVYMFFYGLGTMPAMLATAWAGQWASGRLRGYFKRVFPVTIVLAGLLLIGRGVWPHRHTGIMPEKGKIPLCTGSGTVARQGDGH